jgi:hypothetical protein
VLAGLKDAGDENLAHLRRLVAMLRSRGAELLIADGDLGDNSESQEALLAALAPSVQAAAPGATTPTATASSAPLPLLINAGNREVRTELDAAEAALRKKGGALIDLSHTRVIDLGDALIVGLPGAFERRLLRTDGTCMYAQADLDALGTFFDKLPANSPPALLVAAVPPRGDGAHGLDFSDGQNVGDARLAPLLTATRARFGLFAQVWEAGGHAIDGQGQPVAGALLSNQLYVNPGAADRTAWPMNDGSTATGLAALITVRGAKASYEPIRELPATARP